MAIGTLWMIDLVLAAVSVGFLVALLYIYGTNFRSLRSPLSFGLIVFASLFIVENLAAIYFYVVLAETGFGGAVAMPMLALNAVELVGFATLFYISWR
ncbi:MAG: hypothetical protein E6K19_08485 [Methanobacteriota archaeon]|jgi:hypothetical protein|nr:MAG: hypothetical protein E6K19_08485 [Euryarchaeota archaeon]